MAPIAAQNLGCAVDLYVPFGDEAQRLRAGIEAHGCLEATGAVQARARPHEIGADPALVIPGSDIVLLVLPAFAHETTLRQIAPYLDRGAWVGAVPARGGFDYCAASVLQEANREDVVLFGLQTLPWACRIEEYGSRVHVLGIKRTVDAASRPSTEIGQMAPALQRMLGLRIGATANLLALTLANTGQIIHPGIMYGLFSRWDGNPLPKVPAFYQGLDAEGAQVLAGLSDDIQAIRARLAHKIDLSAVQPLQDWLVRSYGRDIANPATLHSAFVSNRAYAGLRAPVREVSPGQYLPDFTARYLTEDVPFGLVVSRALAQLAEVETPVMDRVIAWAGDRLGRDYLGQQAHQARIPQNYGLNTLEQLIDFSLERTENA